MRVHEDPHVARKVLRVVARLRQPLQKHCAGNVTGTPSHDRAGRRIGVAVFEVDYPAAPVERRPIDDHSLNGDVLHRLEQRIRRRGLGAPVRAENGHRQGRARAEQGEFGHSRAGDETALPKRPIRERADGEGEDARTKAEQRASHNSGHVQHRGRRPRRPPLQESGLRDRRDRGEDEGDGIGSRAKLENCPFQRKVSAAPPGPNERLRHHLARPPPHTAPARPDPRKKAYGRPELGFFMAPSACALENAGGRTVRPTGPAEPAFEQVSNPAGDSTHP